MSAALSYVPNHYTLEFGANWRHKVQQMASRLKEYVTMENYTGEAMSFNFLDEGGEPDEITERAGETRHSDLTSEIRWIQTRAYDRAHLIDRFDETLLGQVAGPNSSVIQAMMKGVHRRVDDRIIAAAVDDAITGKNRDTTSSFDTANQRVDVDYVESGSAVNSNLTIAKLRKVRSIFGANEVAGQDVDGTEEPIIMAVTQSQLDSLLRTTEVTSGDYNIIKTLVHGQVNTFMGIRFKRIQRLTTTAANTRRCLAWVKSGICFSMGDWNTYMDRLPTRSHALQIRWEGRMGGVRTEEKKVIDVLCYEA